jgi:secreted PhoX family phosphatase
MTLKFNLRSTFLSLTFFLGILLISCDTTDRTEGLGAIRSDEITLIDDLQYQILASWGDDISETHHVGFDCGYVAFMPDQGNSGMLWVSHPDVNPLFISGYSVSGEVARHRDMINKELYYIGGSLMRVAKSGGEWEVIKEPTNMRFTGAQSYPLEWHHPVANRTAAFGATAPGDGAVTPWGTLLLGETNYRKFYGDMNHATRQYEASKLLWETFLSKPTQHYGWILEIDPSSKEIKKQIGLGRFYHSATLLVTLPDQRVVVYTTEGEENGLLFKYISDTPGRIYPGKLYAANFKNGVWRPIDYEEPLLKDYFTSETQMMERAHEAGVLMGATVIDKPSGLVQDQDGSLVISLGANSVKGSLYGGLMRFTPAGEDHSAESFNTKMIIDGGEDSGFALPSDLAIDPSGNLWFTSSIDAEEIGKEPYTTFGNNALYVIPKSPEYGGEIIRVATAPMDAKFAGLSFTADGSSLFLSVSQPGKLSTPGNYTSHWPKGGESVPKSSVIVISGEFLEELMP